MPDADDRGSRGQLDPQAQGTPTADVIVSEERLLTGTTRQVTSRVRFGRRVVVEERTIAVTVRREEFYIEHIDTTDAAPAAPEAGHQASTPAVATGPAGPEKAPQEVIIVLREERPVVTTTVVPVARVTVHIDSITEATQIATTLAREKIEVTSIGRPSR
jgi:stress response protein YsnF